MSRAEDEAKKVYPDNPYYGGRSAQKLFAEGYAKAEKDYKDILDLCNDVVSEYKNGSLGDGTIKELQRLMMTIRS